MPENSDISRMKIEEKNIILKAIKDNITASDYDIAKIPEVRKCFGNIKYDTIRRTINLIRREHDLQTPRSQIKKNIDKDIPIYLNKYKGFTVYQVTAKLHLKYPIYKFNTIRTYVTQYAHWGEG